MSLTPNSAVSPQTPNMGKAQLTANPGTYVTIYTGGTNGTKVSGLFVTNTDSATHLVTVQIKSGATSYGGCSVTIPITAGFANAIPAINMMSAANWPGLPIDAQGNPYFFLLSGDLLVFTYATAFSAGVLNAVAIVTDF